MTLRETFSPTGSLPNNDYSTATLLKDGRVFYTHKSFGDQEIYDPKSRSFSGCNVFLNHGPATATLLQDGSVLLAGNGSGPYVYTP